MAIQITAYPLSSTAGVAYTISAAGVVRHVNLRDTVPTVWYSADPAAVDGATKTFAIFLDGATVTGTYVGTYMDGHTAKHVYVS